MLDLLMYRGNVLVSSLTWAIILKKTCKVLNKRRRFIFQIVASYTICIRELYELYYRITQITGKPVFYIVVHGYLLSRNQHSTVN